MGEIPDDDFQPDFLGFSWGFVSFQHATATTAATKRQEDASGRRSVGLPNNTSWIHRSLVSAKQQQQQISNGQAKPTPAPDACLRSRKPPPRSQRQHDDGA